MTNINQKNIIFYYNKHSLHMKMFILFLICILCVAIIFLVVKINIPTFSRILVSYLCYIISASIWHILTISRYISLRKFFEVTPEYIVYFYNFLGSAIISEKDFYWVNIISIEKVYGIFSNKIYIAYKDSYSNKIKKGKIKIHDSEIPYEEIYNILVSKWNEYKSQNSKVR